MRSIRPGLPLALAAAFALAACTSQPGSQAKTASRATCPSATPAAAATAITQTAATLVPEPVAEIRHHAPL